MNCDQAFDAMTSSDRMESPALSRHLASCRRCQQMQQTLEPALGLFDVVEQESMIAPERRHLTEEMSSVQMAHQVAAQLATHRRTSRRVDSRRRLWGAMCVAMAAGFLLSIGLTLLVTEPSPSSPSMLSQCTWLNRDAVGGDQEASVVAVTCVACHLSQKTGEQNDHASLIIFSTELERIVTQWRTGSNAVAPGTGPMFLSKMLLSKQGSLPQQRLIGRTSHSEADGSPTEDSDCLA